MGGATEKNTAVCNQARKCFCFWCQAGKSHGIHLSVAYPNTFIILTCRSLVKLCKSSFCFTPAVGLFCSESVDKLSWFHFTHTNIQRTKIYQQQAAVVRSLVTHHALFYSRCRVVLIHIWARPPCSHQPKWTGLRKKPFSVDQRVLINQLIGWWRAAGSRWKGKQRPKWSQLPLPQKYVSAVLPLCCSAPVLFLCFLRGKSLAEKNENFFEKEKEQKAEEVGERRHDFSFILSSERAFCLCEPHAGVLICARPGRRVGTVLNSFLFYFVPLWMFVWCHQRVRERSYVCRWKPDWAQRAAERRTPQRQLPSTKSHLQHNKSTQTAVSDTSDTRQWRHEVVFPLLRPKETAELLTVTQSRWGNCGNSWLWCGGRHWNRAQM